MRRQLDHLAGEQVERPSGAARRRGCAGGRHQQGFLLARQLAFGAGRDSSLAPLQIALHKPPFGPVNRRAADAHTGGDVLVANAGVRRQKDLRSLELARPLSTAAQKGSKGLSGINRFDV